MRKLLPHFTAVLFAVFILGVGGAVLFYSFNGLGLIFPGDLIGQLFGLLLFDLAMFIWFMVFVSKCESTMQYVFAGLGFLVGLGGTLGLVGIEVGLSSGMLEAGSMQKPLTYIFIGVLLGHLVLLYLHHGAAPHLSAGISIGIEKAKIVDKAEKDAEKILTENVALLSAPLAHELVKRVMQDLNLKPAQGEIIDLPALSVQTSQEDAPAAAGDNSLDVLKGWFLNASRRFRKYEQTAPIAQPGAPIEEEPAEVEMSEAEEAEFWREANRLNAERWQKRFAKGKPAAAGSDDTYHPMMQMQPTEEKPAGKDASFPNGKAAG